MEYESLSTHALRTGQLKRAEPNALTRTERYAATQVPSFRTGAEHGLDFYVARKHVQHLKKTNPEKLPALIAVLEGNLPSSQNGMRTACSKVWKESHFEALALGVRSCAGGHFSDPFQRGLSLLLIVMLRCTG